MTERNDFQKLKRKAFSAAEKGFSRRRVHFKAWGKLTPEELNPKEALVNKPIKTETDELQYVIRLLEGDKTLAQKILNMKTSFPTATTPELVVMEWCDRKKVKYEYQSYKFGGRAKGKGVPDFASILGPYWNIWEVEGDYWHSAKFETKEDQRGGRNRLMGNYYNGLMVKYWVQLWESDIYRRRDYIFEMALQGINLRQGI